MLKKVGLIVGILLLALLVGSESPNSSDPDKMSGERSPNSAELKAKIEQLIEQLGADDWRVREKARRSLEDIGEPAEPFLIVALQHLDPEVRFRAKRLLDQLELVRLMKSEKIAYVSGGNLWVMNTDGTGQTQLTDLRCGASKPKWSPDRKIIVFEGLDGIYIINADGSGLKKLTQGKHDRRPTWTPDSRKILFITIPKGKPRYALYTMDPDGSNQKVLLKMDTWRGAHCLSFSPDGQKIAYVSGEGIRNDTIYLMDANGQNQWSLGIKGFNPAWSPDGKYIAYESDHDLWIMEANGSNQVRLTHDKKGAQRPSWSPDGKKILYYVDELCGPNGWCSDHSQIYMIDISSKERHKIGEKGCYDPSWY